MNCRRCTYSGAYGKDILIGHFNYLAKDGGVFIRYLCSQKAEAVNLKKAP